MKEKIIITNIYKDKEPNIEKLNDIIVEILDKELQRMIDNLTPMI